MAFQKGQAKPAGSGRKPGQKALKDFSRLLDNPEFNLKEQIRVAVRTGDSKLIASLAQLWRALATPAPNQAADVEITDAEVLKLLQNPPA